MSEAIIALSLFCLTNNYSGLRKDTKECVERLTHCLIETGSNSNKDCYLKELRK